MSGWYWIRAVESPYYHSYLQTQQPTAAATASGAATTTTATAVLDAGSSAGQFNIIDGQLVLYRGGGAAELYLWVEDPADKTQRALATWFDAAGAKNPYGTFAFSGDTVTWVDPDVARGNTAAFFVCPDSAEGVNALFVNTGAYGYETPSGCYDVDVSLPVTSPTSPLDSSPSRRPGVSVWESSVFDGEVVT